MKILFIGIAIILLTFFGIQIFAQMGQRNIESYPYEVVKKYDSFEIRNYEASLFTSVKLPIGSYKESSGRGFSILAGYIFGGNDRKEKIAMTSPVAMSLEDSMTMMFLVPKENKDNLPKPNDEQIVFEEVPAKTVAAITFGGWADDDRIKEHRATLTAALDRQGIKYTNRFYFLGYNPPYEVLNRKNEVIVELEEND